jgi:small GTP-binding protein
VVSVNYVSAKVVLVGDSGVGKSALGIRLAEKEFRPTESTHAARFWPIKVGRRPDLPGGVQAEITLWDLAGQPEYRIVHQLFLNDVNLALLLFDCSDPADPFGSVPYWAKVLRKQAPPQSLKFLVSARCDVSPVTVDDHQINLVLAEHSLNRYLRTSAMTGEGIDQLYQQICESIPWHELPRTSTPRLFQVIRDYLLERKGVGDTFVAMEEVRNAIRRRSHSYEPSDAELDMVVRQHQARGLIYLLHPKPDTWWVLLQPELLNQYAASIIRAARNHPSGIGAIRETDVLTASFEMSGFGRLQPAEERLLLEATIELFISHELCIREMGLLVFPSQINLSPPQAAAGHPQAEAIYQFSGSIEAIYASLVVRLTHTSYFQRIDQWKYAAEFSRGGQRLGFSMRQISEATAELEVYFHKDVNDSDRVTFVAFITDHLLMKGIDVREYIRLYCPKCGHEIENHAAIEARIAAGKLDIPCQYCDTSVIIPRGIDERYKSDPAYAIKQRDLSQTAHARTRQELQDFHSDREQFFEETPSPRLRILHLSDIHANVPGEGRLRRTQLEADLMKELGIRRLAYVGVSGDIAMRASAEEYDTGYEVIDGITKRFGLDPSRVVIVPGNHDVNWERSRRSYTFVFRAELAETPDPGHSIDAGPEGILVRCSESYPQRFANFDEHLYRRAFIGAQYPLKYARQAVIHLHPEDRILFLALNSAWEIDHHFRDRASINMEALTHALDQLQDGQYEGWLKIAIFHHPVTGREAMNDDFMQLLAVHGFQIVLHGHVHEAKEGFYKYDDKRGIHIIGAGTFGAPTREQVPGIPLQYNLLSFDPTTRRLTVETRKKEKPDGAWMADARWGDKNNPSPRYTIQLK